MTNQSLEIFGITNSHSTNVNHHTSKEFKLSTSYYEKNYHRELLQTNHIKYQINDIIKSDAPLSVIMIILYLTNISSTLEY